MIISVASGKGGTGKTTVSTNLALSIRCRPAAMSAINDRILMRTRTNTAYTDRTSRSFNVLKTR